jgi:maltose alpha-D-glucosyltransferase/alpha-amylase
MTVLETEADSVFAHRVDHDGTTVCTAHNLADEPVTVTLSLDDAGETLLDLLGNGDVRRLDDGHFEIDLEGYDYRWVRLERSG